MDIVEIENTVRVQKSKTDTAASPQKELLGSATVRLRRRVGQG